MIEKPCRSYHWKRGHVKGKGLIHGMGEKPFYLLFPEVSKGRNLEKQVTSDSELLSRSKKGDKEAFGELVLRYERVIYFLCLKAVGDHDEASDLAQSVFVRAYMALSGFKEESSFKTWLYQIAINLTKNYWRDRARKRKSELAPESLVEEPATLERLSGEDTLSFVWSEAMKLPEKQRAALILRADKGLSYKEIAKILNTREGAVKVNYHHAVRKLRALWEEREKEGQVSGMGETK
ncbi:MAG: RNA polymerase sigma factor [Candidatus Eisenbacteria bacterium]|nr:RNA polymerase sigma factor [Candidatus Eisenbacteria bacterium]